jgi:hypothetical protein
MLTPAIGFKEANISSLSQRRKKPALTRMCDARRGQGELPFESDFGTSDILAAVDRNCISPVRD